MDIYVRTTNRSLHCRIYEALMGFQNNEVESLKKWMTEIENRISHMSDVKPDLASLTQQLENHNQLQEDIKKQQSVVDSLSQFVVLVDDNAAQSNFVMCRNFDFS